MSALVSVCLPTLNAGRFLRPRISSILSQTLTDWELVVCDSYSDDGTWEELQKLRSDSRVRLYQVPKEGLYAGWNECIRRASGKYVYVATADDTCSPDCLERLVGALDGCEARGDEVDLAVCDFDYIDEHGEIIEHKYGTAGRQVYGDLMEYSHLRSGALELLVHLCVTVSWVTITAVLVRRSLFDRVGLFPQDCGPVADKVWAVRSALHSDTVYVPGKLATWRQHSSQSSSGETRATRRELVGLYQEALVEGSDLLPSTWKSDPKWLDKLLRCARRRYLADYHIDRESAKRSSKRFIGGLCQAIVSEPGYVARRLASALSWNTPEMEGDEAYLSRLVREWNVPWPSPMSTLGDDVV